MHRGRREWPPLRSAGTQHVSRDVVDVHRGQLVHRQMPEQRLERTVDHAAVPTQLDVDCAPELRRALIEAIDEHPARPVVVDLEGVDFIDSAGLGVLVAGLKRAKDGEGDLVLVATGQGVIKVLELTGLTRVFEIHPSRAAALGTRE